MFIDDNSLRFVTRLQHMATVEIIGVLLRDPEYREMMKKAVWERRSMARIGRHGNKNLKYMIEQVEMGVDKLPLLDALKIDIKTSLRPIGNSTAAWLAYVARHTPVQLKTQYWTKTIYELIGHLQWNNVGCLDGQRTLESYVSNRETIDFVIWNQLCYHCMEEEIKQFSNTIDWKNCRKCFDSVFSIYWYQRIYGQFPTKKMYSSFMYRYVDRWNGREAMLDGEKIVRLMFSEDQCIIRRTARNPSAIAYFRNCLEDEKEFNKLMYRARFWSVTDGVVLHLLRTFSLNSLLSYIKEDCVNSFMRCLVQLPFILLIDDWIRVFETSDREFFVYFFENIGMLGRNLMDDFNKMLYEPFEKVWRIHNRRFGSDRDAIAQTFVELFARNDVILSELMFRELKEEQRTFLIEDAKRSIKQKKRIKVNERLLKEFSGRVLENSEEGKLFSVPCKG